MRKLYDVIYCDPPWEYNNKNTGSSKKSGMTAGASHKYKTMNLDSLIKINVPSKNNSILFIWVTAPFLEESFKLINAWGFKYKTTLIWDKVHMGMGFWFRGQTEYLLLAVKGKIKPWRAQVRNIYTEKRTKHSRKPAYFRKLIEMLGYKDKLEMFARSGNREGWDLFGFEAENSIKL